MPRSPSYRGAPHLTTRAESPFYQIKWYDAERGRERTQSTGTTDIKEASRQLAEFIDPTARAMGGDTPQAARSPAEILVADVVKAFYEQHAKRQAQGPAVRAAEKHVRQLMGSVTLGDLAGDYVFDIIQEYIDARLEEEAAPATIGREIANLRTAVTAFVRGNREAGLVIEIPAPPTVGGRPHWLTQEQADKLRQGCVCHHTWLFIELALATAARAGALFDLEWTQVDLAADTIHLNPSGRVQGPKARASVRLTPRLKEILTQVRQESPDARYVLEIYGRRITSNIRKSFGQAVERAGLDPKCITPNTLRHTAASWMVQAGVPLFEVAAFLGHSTTRMVEKHYGHLSPDYQTRAIKALSGNAKPIIAPQFHLKKKEGSKRKASNPLKNMVEPCGIEPQTSTMPL